MILYLIAGPPGIGKSTMASELIPKGVPILDQDLAGYQYKKLGFNNYKDLASLSTNQKIREYLFAGEDFALELNLGFTSHYDFLKAILSLNVSIKLHLLLFFTDSISLCLDRAQIRFINGGHEVKPEIVEEMYRNTIPLFQENQHLFHSVRLIDVANTYIRECTRTQPEFPLWVRSNGLEKYLQHGV